MFENINCAEYKFYTFPCFGDLDLWGAVDIYDIIKWNGKAFEAYDKAIDRLDTELEDVEMPGFADEAYAAVERLERWWNHADDDEKAAFYCRYVDYRKRNGDLGA